MLWLKRVFLVIGSALLAYTVSQSGGITPLVEALRGIGWWFAIAFVATIVAQYLRTEALRLIVKPYGSRASFYALLRIRLIGDALNYLSFAGPLLGDPAKATLLATDAPVRRSPACIALDRYLYAIASVLFIVVAAVCWSGGPATAVCVLVGVAIVLTPLVIARYSDVDSSTMYAVIVLHSVSNVFMALEAAVLLRGIGVVDSTIVGAISAEALNKVLNAIFFFVPLQIGVAEGGSAVLFQMLSAGSAVGLTLGLARRARALIWSALGLILLCTNESQIRNATGVSFSQRRRDSEARCR